MQPGWESGNLGFCCSSETRIKPYAQRQARGSCSHPHTYKSTFRQRHFPLVNLPAGRQSKCIVLNTQMGAEQGGGGELVVFVRSAVPPKIMSASGRHLGRRPKCGSEGGGGRVHFAHNSGSDLIFWIKASLHNTSVPMTEQPGSCSCWHQFRASAA